MTDNLVPTREVTLLAEGTYPAKLTDLEAYDTQGSGRPLVKMHFSVEGHHMVIYQPCGRLLRECILANKSSWIGKIFTGHVKHAVYTNQVYHQLTVEPSSQPETQNDRA